MTSWTLEASTGTVACLGEKLHAYFRAKVDNTWDADDLVNDTWVAAGRAFEGRCSLHVYLFAIARRLVAEYWRWKKRQMRRRRTLVAKTPGDILETTPDLDLALDEEAEVNQFRLAVARIPSPFRETVQLVHRGYGHHEIAEALGIHYNTVRSRYARGKALLEALIEEERKASPDVEPAECLEPAEYLESDEYLDPDDD